MAKWRAVVEGTDILGEKREIDMSVATFELINGIVSYLSLKGFVNEIDFPRLKDVNFLIAREYSSEDKLLNETVYNGEFENIEQSFKQQGNRTMYILSSSLKMSDSLPD